MATNHAAIMTPRPPLRLWPGVTALVLQWLLWIGALFVLDEGFLLSVLGGVVLGLVILLWWLFFSRADWVERIGAIVVMVA
jgi:hypothetical protein